MKSNINARKRFDGTDATGELPPYEFRKSCQYARNAARKVEHMVCILEQYAAHGKDEESSLLALEDGLFILRHFCSNVMSHIDNMERYSGYDMTLASEDSNCVDIDV